MRVNVRRWVRIGFLSWAVLSTAWLANSVRTRGVDPATLKSSPITTVADREETLDFTPAAARRKPAALIFICGSGIAAEAYVPLVRPIADAGHAVFIVRLPYRFAPFESHKAATVDRVRDIIASHRDVARWVVAGHSLGGALACRVAEQSTAGMSALVLIGTTHPKRQDLSSLRIPVTKVYASNDRIAPPEVTLGNSRLLPSHTKWIRIDGGNHSQFGYYGHQLFDGKATISREEQQRVTRSALLDALR